MTFVPIFYFIYSYEARIYPEHLILSCQIYSIFLLDTHQFLFILFFTFAQHLLGKLYFILSVNIWLTGWHSPCFPTILNRFNSAETQLEFVVIPFGSRATNSDITNFIWGLWCWLFDFKALDALCGALWQFCLVMGKVWHFFFAAAIVRVPSVWNLVIG